MLAPAMGGDVFEGRSVIVTGASRGLGRAIAERFLSEGAAVALVDIDRATLREAEEELRDGHGERVLAEGCDVTSRTEVAKATASIIGRRGRIDVLVNNAGVSTCSPIEELAESDWDRVMDVNAKGTFLCCQSVVPHMIAAGRGSIVSIGSQAARRGEPFVAHYCAAKAAVLGFTRALAVELAPDIRVNAVCPGIVETDMIEGELRWRAEQLGDDPAMVRSEWLRSVPLARFQPPEQVAAMVAFLASDNAGDITGQAISVDGGAVMV